MTTKGYARKVLRDWKYASTLIHLKDSFIDGHMFKRATIHRWIKKEGFPCGESDIARLINHGVIKKTEQRGVYTLSHEAIDRFLKTAGHR